MKYRNSISLMLVIIAFLALSNVTTNTYVRQNKPSTSPGIILLNTYQTDFDMTNNSLLDYTLLQTEFSIDTPAYIRTSYQTFWNSTGFGTALNGIAGNPYYYLPAGTFNMTLFLGLGLLKAVNAPNTLVNGSYALNMTVINSNDATSNSTINFPIFEFSYNTSQISDAIQYGALFSPVEFLFNQQTESFSSYQWNYTHYNNVPDTIITEINNYSQFTPTNGTISLTINSTSNGLPIGKVFNNNTAFTPNNVPVGYPFSLLKLPRQLSETYFQLIMDNQFKPYSDKFIYNYTTTIGTMSVNVSDSFNTGNTFYYFEYNNTSGVLLNYLHQFQSTSSNFTEKLTLTNYNSTTDYSTIPVVNLNTTSTQSSVTTNTSSTEISNTTTSTTENRTSSLLTTSSTAGKTNTAGLNPFYLCLPIIVLAFIFRRKDKV